MKQRPVIMWFRNDLRLADNSALAACANSGAPVIPVFIWAPGEQSGWSPGGASRWWLHHSLQALNESLESSGSKLILRRGSVERELLGLVRTTGASGVYWNQRAELWARVQESQLEALLREEGVESHAYDSTWLVHPSEIATADGKPYQVFTPFWRRLRSQEPSVPVPAPKRLEVPESWPASLPSASLDLLPGVDWAMGLRSTWRPGERGAEARVKDFIRDGLAGYARGRDRPDRESVSRLSPHLHFGEISPKTVYFAIKLSANVVDGAGAGAEAFLRELGWREFAQHLMYHFPKTVQEPLRDKFAGFPWLTDEEHMRSWQKGETGYPIVDAGMRQLWETGWMHNRVRMIAASFLVKDLLIHWLEGARWFWDTLVDADLASNTLNWQWAAGCGADAAPYFRIFNPVLQGEKFDPEGAYVSRWVPELARLDRRWVHKPWQAPEAELARAGVELGWTYPRPIVDHGDARRRALAAFASIRAE